MSYYFYVDNFYFVLEWYWYKGCNIVYVLVILLNKLIVVFYLSIVF